MKINVTRQIALDTETTGINKFGLHYKGHKIIEIGAVEIVNRRLTNNQFHIYLNPNRSIDREAYQVHGISDQFLINKPIFADIANEFLLFIQGSELIIHNASFDLGFLNYELQSSGSSLRKIESYCTVIDSLKLARKMFPGQRNSLDALCERYLIDKSSRDLHNALIDARLLAHVFLSMTGGQTKMQFIEMDNDNQKTKGTINYNINKLDNISTLSIMEKVKSLKIIFANKIEQLEHQKCLDLIEKTSKNCLWKRFK